MTSKRSPATVGYIAVAGAALAWAVGGTYARTLLDRGASSVELAQGRAYVAVVGMGLLLFWRPAKRVKPSVVLGARWWLYLAVFGAALASANFSYYAAIGLLPVAIAIVIQYTAPGLVVAWKSIVNRRAPSRRVVVALLLALFGVALLSEFHLAIRDEGSLDSLGLFFAAVSSASFATYIVLGERIGRAAGSHLGVLYGFVAASAIWIVVQAFRGRPETLLDPQFTLPILFLGVFTTILPFLLFVWALTKVSASAAGIVSTLEPVGAAVLAFVFLDQSLNGVQVVGAAAVIVGIAIVQTSGGATPRSPAGGATPRSPAGGATPRSPKGIAGPAP